jgi:hypothetical protein
MEDRVELGSHVIQFWETAIDLSHSRTEKELYKPLSKRLRLRQMSRKRQLQVGMPGTPRGIDVGITMESQFVFIHFAAHDLVGDSVEGSSEKIDIQ